MAEDVNLDDIAKSTRAEGYSGADCAALLREAGLAVLRDNSSLKRKGANFIKGPLQITTKHFEYAFNHVMPSVSKKDQKKYDRIRDRMARARSRGGVGDNVQDGKEDEETLPVRPPVVNV